MGSGRRTGPGRDRVEDGGAPDVLSRAVSEGQEEEVSCLRGGTPTTNT